MTSQLSSRTPTLAPSDLDTGEKPRFVDETPSSGSELTNVPKLKGWQKAFTLFLLCSASFFDIFNATCTLIALPEISDDLHFALGALQWIVTAYTLTFAAFLLFAGRLTDIYHPKPVFVLGYVAVGVSSVLCAVSVHSIMLLVFRAVQGIGAAMTLDTKRKSHTCIRKTNTS